MRGLVRIWHLDNVGCVRLLTINLLVALGELIEGGAIAWLSVTAHNQAEGIASWQAAKVDVPLVVSGGSQPMLKWRVVG